MITAAAAQAATETAVVAAQAATTTAAATTVEIHPAASAAELQDLKCDVEYYVTQYRGAFCSNEEYHNRYGVTLPHATCVARYQCKFAPICRECEVLQMKIGYVAYTVPF